MLKRLKRKPDLIVNDDQGKVYLRRWWLIPRNRIFNIYLHNFQGSDSDRGLHDHPWASFSIMLKGEVIEHTKAHDYEGTGNTQKANITQGAMRYRQAKFLHRLELVSPSAWTIFITGPVRRNWGFLMKSGVWLRHQIVEAALKNRHIDDALRRAEKIQREINKNG